MIRFYKIFPADLNVERLFFSLGAVFALIAVGAGAFGSHGLRGRLDADMLGVFEIGVRYQMYHALALLGAAWAATRWPGAWVTASGALFAVGIIIFSGSLYVLSLSGIRWLGAITPIGGLALLAGWLCLALAPFRS